MDPIVNLGNPNDPGLKEYIVTLKSMEDAQSLYDDMETEGGNLYIPHRAVECANRRPISRNTHYMLTYSEALELRKDPRVLTVELNPRDLGYKIINNGFTQTNDNFSKNAFSDSDDINWGLPRMMRRTNPTLWGISGEQTRTETLNSSLSGKNVDVVIVDDGSPWPTVLEYAQNPDGTGYSRMVEYDWYQHLPAITDAYNSITNIYSYTATRIQEHGGHVTGTAAGNTQGWARDANIYNLSFDSYGLNDSRLDFCIDLVREFHKNKPVNPLTGLKNPTIMNNSWGYSAVVKFFPEFIEKMVIRGVEYNGVVNFTDPQYGTSTFDWKLNDFYYHLLKTGVIPSGFGNRFPVRVTSVDEDMIDAMRDGIIVVAAAGNDGWYQDTKDGPDYNNYFVYHGGYSPETFYFNRGGTPGAAEGLNENEKVICVGALGEHSYHLSAQNRWFFTAASGMYSASEKIQGTLIDPRPYTGTRIISTGVNTATTTPITYAIPDVPKFDRTLYDFRDRSIPTGSYGGWDVTLPFGVNYLGETYTSIYVHMFSFITFGGRCESVSAETLSETNPPLPKILLSPFPSYASRLFSETKGVSPNRTYTLRHENLNNKVWEVTFYENTPNQIDIHYGQNCAWLNEYTSTWTGLNGIYDEAKVPPGQFSAGSPLSGIIYITGVNGKPESGTRITTGRYQVNDPTTPYAVWSNGHSETIPYNIVGASGFTTVSTTPTHEYAAQHYKINDEGAWEINLPFNIEALGDTFSKVTVSTNSIITFGGVNDFTVPDKSLSDVNWRWPWGDFNSYYKNPGRGIYIAASDNSAQRILYKTIGSAPNRTFIIRYEGKIDALHEYGMNSSEGYPGFGDLVWEVTFHENTPTQIDVQIEKNDRYQPGAPFIFEPVDQTYTNADKAGSDGLPNQWGGGYYT